jgi:hypothetical protein
MRWKGPWFKVSAISGEGCMAVCQQAARFLAEATAAGEAK